jgi:hypothetical protein
MEFKGFLTHYGFVVPKHVLKARFGDRYDDFIDKLIITYVPKFGAAKKAAMFTHIVCGGQECVCLPRTLIDVLSRKVLTRIDILFRPIITIDTMLHIDLYHNQQLIVNYLSGTVFTDQRRIAGRATCILNMLAGMGKTYVAAALIARLRMRTLYIVPKRPLASQAVKDIRACLYADDVAQTMWVGAFDKKAEKAVMLRTGRTDPLGRTKSDPQTVVDQQGVTVIVINSALMRDAGFFSRYSFIIMDEVHSYCSAKRMAIFRKASAPLILGMSATTNDRTDGFDKIAHKELAFDGVIHASDIDGWEVEDVVFDCTARVIHYSGPPSHTQNLTHKSTGKVFTHYMYNQFIDDPYRLKLTVSELIRLYDWADEGRTHSIYVFAEEIDILKKAREALSRELRGRNRADIAADMATPEIDVDLAMFTGGQSAAEINGSVMRSRVLFSTYGYAGTGISIEKMTAILFLTPRKANMKQILARILRRGGDTLIPRVVVDLVDSKTSLRYQLGQRGVIYDFYRFKVENVKVRYTDIHLGG